MKSLKAGQAVRLRTKRATLADNWKPLTATRETESFTLKYDSSSDWDCNYADSDEEHLVVSANNWLIGWYSFLPEESSYQSLSDDGAVICDVPACSEEATHSFPPNKPSKCQRHRLKGMKNT